MRTADNLAKLSDDLAYLLGESIYAANQSVPVAISAQGEQFAALIELIERLGGTVRYVLEFSGSVAAWLPIGAVELLAEYEIVQEIELDQRVHIA
jgi:hypothetical protein